MTTQAHEQALEQACERFNAGDLDGYIQTLYAPDAALHFLPPELPQGQAGARLFYGGFLAAFPDAQLIIDQTVSEGDRLAARYHVDVTHQGDFNGIPATGKRATLPGLTILRFENGTVVERWNEADFLGLLQQLGAIPAQ